MFAQQSVDTIPSWITLILQGGSFGLIGYIIIVMYPKSTKETCDAQERRDDKFLASVAAMQEKFDNRNVQIVAAIERQTQTFVSALVRSSTTITDAVTEAAKNGK